jgi:hypothetical protein
MLLILPRAASAGIIEIIAEMSGPQMIGYFVECRLLPSGTWDSCKFPHPLYMRTPPSRKYWISIGGGLYTSTTRDVGGVERGWFDDFMLTFEPILEFESKTTPVQLYHGVIGFSYNLLAGKGYSPFANAALKFRPIGIVIPLRENLGLDLSYDLRLYPRGFTPEDFGRTPVTPSVSESEWVHAISIGFRRKL